MDVDIVCGREPQTHAPGKVGHAAERLTVHKVAPAADRLPDQKTHHAAVGHGPKTELADAAEDIGGQKACNDCAVDGKTAVPNAEHFHEVERAVRIAVEIQIENDVVDAGANDAGGDRPEDHVDHIVARQAEFGRLAHAEPETCQHAGGKQHAVPVDAVADVKKLAGSGELPVPEKTGEADGSIAKTHRYDHSFPLRCAKRP